MTPPPARHNKAQADSVGWAQAADEFSTIRDLFRFGVSQLGRFEVSFGHGTSDAQQEVTWLIQSALSLPAQSPLDPYLDARLARIERSEVLALLERRCLERVPAAYLIGQAWLTGVCFKSDARALVPRSLIAEALDQNLSGWLTSEPNSILDLCTGGGSLAILAAMHWSDARVMASDLSSDALSLAAENLALHGLSGRISLHQSDLFASLPAERFDLILCNPPYVNKSSMQSLPPEYRAEPSLALAGGDDGMDLIRLICEAAPRFLNPKGALLLEIGHERENFERTFGRLELGYIPVSQGDQMLVWLPRASLLRMQPAAKSKPPMAAKARKA